MNGQAAKQVGEASRTIIIVRDFAGGMAAALVCAVIATIVLRTDQLAFSYFLYGVTLLLLVIVPLQLYLRLRKRKNESRNLAYQATDGYVAINKPSKLSTAIPADLLAKQQTQAWAGPLTSNQNITFTVIAQASTYNAENVLMLTNDLLLGLVIGPGQQTSSSASSLLTMLPIGNMEKAAFGAVFDNSAIRSHITNEVASKSAAQLFSQYGGFAVPLQDIKTVSMSGQSLAITFRSGKRRTWTPGKADSQLTTFCQAMQAALQTRTMNSY